MLNRDEVLWGKQVEQGNGDQRCPGGSRMGHLSIEGQDGLMERVVLEQNLEGGKGIGYGDVWRRAFQAERRAHAQTRRWGAACWVEDRQGGRWDWSHGAWGEQWEAEGQAASPASQGLALTLRHGAITEFLTGKWNRFEQDLPGCFPENHPWAEGRSGEAT